MATRQQPDWLETEDNYHSRNRWQDPQRRLQHQVEIQSRQIDQVLSQHQVPAGVRGGSVRPHWVSFDLAAQLSDGWDRLRRLTSELTGEIATALGVPEVRLERHEGTLRLAVKRNDPHPVDLLDLLDLVPEAAERHLSLGLNHQGQPVMLNLDQPDLHNILIAGVSGAGKSSLMRSIAVSLALTCRQSQAQLAVIGLGSAPSGITRRPNPLYPVNYLPHLLFPVATQVDEVIEALAYLAEEVAYRADHHVTSPALIVLVDDADMLLRRVGGPAAEQLAALLHAPAEAGVRVIVGASSPALPDLWRMLQHNVDLRLVGRMADERAAQAATGLEKSYAQYLDGRGDFIAISAAGIEPFQAAYIDDYDLHLTLGELHRSSGPVLLAQTQEDKRSLPPSWSDAEEQGFTYDPAAGRANMEADDGGRMSTIEIAVDPVEGSRAPEQRLSWLDDNGMGGLGGGLSLPLPAGAQFADETPVDESDSYRDAWEAFAGHPLDEDGGHSTDLQKELADGGAEASGPQKPIEDLVESDGGGKAHEMLPFEEDEPESVPGRVEEAQQGEQRAQERSLNDARSWKGGGLTLPNKERAQTLWTVEPIYTDIEDELWETPDDDDDDWRHRLH